jgi:hypothetical protein
LEESARKNLSQMADNAVGVTYHRLHHFLTEAPWSAMQVNDPSFVTLGLRDLEKPSRIGLLRFMPNL